jgi:hypothetical protein
VSYREEDGQVILTMSREDYNKLLMTFALATMRGIEFRGEFPKAVENTLSLMNRLNDGNPNYTPYQVEKK